MDLTAPPAPGRTGARAGPRRYALILGVALATAVVGLEITLPVMGASQYAEFSLTSPGTEYELSFGFVRVLFIGVVLTWLVTEAVVLRARTDRRKRLAPALVVVLGALLLGAWTFAADRDNFEFGCAISYECVPVPWPGPHVPLRVTQEPVDITLPESQWPPTVLTRDVDYLLGPGLALLALVVGACGARRTVAMGATRARTSRIASRFALGLVGVLVASGVAGLFACAAALAAEDPSAWSFVTDQRVWGVLAVIATGFAVSGRHRGDLVLVLVLVQAWTLVAAWLSGESYAFLLLAALALSLPAIAATWRPLARSLDRLIDPSGATAGSEDDAATTDTATTTVIDGSTI